MAMVLKERQEWLLVQEQELNRKEGTIATSEDGLAAFKCALGRVCKERNAEHAQTEAVQQDYLMRSRALTSKSKHSINLNRMLEEC
jgi:hypothetical protein